MLSFLFGHVSPSIFNTVMSRLAHARDIYTLLTIPSATSLPLPPTPPCMSDSPHLRDIYALLTHFSSPSHPSLHAICFPPPVLYQLFIYTLLNVTFHIHPTPPPSLYHADFSLFKIYNKLQTCVDKS